MESKTQKRNEQILSGGEQNNKATHKYKAGAHRASEGARIASEGARIASEGARIASEGARIASEVGRRTPAEEEVVVVGLKIDVGGEVRMRVCYVSFIFLSVRSFLLPTCCQLLPICCRSVADLLPTQQTRNSNATDNRLATETKEKRTKERGKKTKQRKTERPATNE